MNGILVFLIGYCLIIGEALFAWKDSFLTVAQMRARGLANGIPLLGHGGIWGDALVLTPMLAWIVYAYANEWGSASILKWTTVSLFITIVLCLMWIRGGHAMPESLTHDGRLPMAGFLHGVYFAGATTIFLLCYFATPGLTFKPAVVISLILGVHLIFGSHIPLSLVGPEWYSGKNYRDLSTWVQISALWGLLAWRCIKI